MDPKPSKDISMLFKVNSLEDLTLLLGLQKGVVKMNHYPSDVYLKSVDVIDPEQMIVRVTGDCTKEFLATFVEKVGGKRISDHEAIRAYRSFDATYEFKMIDVNTDYTEQ